MASAKIKHMKIMRIINNNAVRGRLSRNYLTRKFITRNICDTKYSRFMVIGTTACSHNKNKNLNGGHTLSIAIRYLLCIACIKSVWTPVRGSISPCMYILPG